MLTRHMAKAHGFEGSEMVVPVAYHSARCLLSCRAPCARARSPRSQRSRRAAHARLLQGQPRRLHRSGSPPRIRRAASMCMSFWAAPRLLRTRPRTRDDASAQVTSSKRNKISWCVRGDGRVRRLGGLTQCQLVDREHDGTPLGHSGCLSEDSPRRRASAASDRARRRQNQAERRGV